MAKSFFSIDFSKYRLITNLGILCLWSLSSRAFRHRGKPEHEFYCTAALKKNPTVTLLKPNVKHRLVVGNNASHIPKFVGLVTPCDLHLDSSVRTWDWAVSYTRRENISSTYEASMCFCSGYIGLNGTDGRTTIIISNPDKKVLHKRPFFSIPSHQFSPKFRPQNLSISESDAMTCIKKLV